MNADPVDAALKALADPSRRKILSLVRRALLRSSQIAERFDISRPAISRHIRVMCRAGLLVEERHGSRCLYRAHSQGLMPVLGYIEHFRRHAALSAGDASAGRGRPPRTQGRDGDVS